MIGGATTKQAIVWQTFKGEGVWYGWYLIVGQCSVDSPLIPTPYHMTFILQYSIARYTVPNQLNTILNHPESQAYFPADEYRSWNDRTSTDM